MLLSMLDYAIIYLYVVSESQHGWTWTVLYRVERLVVMSVNVFEVETYVSVF
jgi:hypothetical protein